MSYFYKYFYSPSLFFKGIFIPLSLTNFYSAVGVRQGRPGNIAEHESQIEFRFKHEEFKLYDEEPPSDIVRDCIRFIFDRRREIEL